MSAEQNPATLDAKVLETAADTHVFNDQGDEVRFGDIFTDSKTIIVFIRHFFCGSCMQYASQLSTVREDALKEASTRIVLVGCGDWKLIENYKRDSEFKGDVYANPDRKLYDALGMISNLHTTPRGEEKRSYLKRSLLSTTLLSIWRGPFKSPSHIGKQGNISQLGGDFIFGPGLTCSYLSRMWHTEDHVEVAELMRAAGITYP